MPEPTTARSFTPPHAGGGLAALGRWLGALAIAALPFVVATYTGNGLLVEIQRLVLLALVAVAAALFGTGPGMLAALVATVSTAYDAVPPGHWVVTWPRDAVPLAVMAACALVVAVAAGAGQGARAIGGRMLQELARAERDEAAQRDLVLRAATELQTLRTALARQDVELATARDATKRAEQARWALVESLPTELRAPLVAVPVPLQLFPPIFTPPPLGAPPFTAAPTIAASTVAASAVAAPTDDSLDDVA